MNAMTLDMDPFAVRVDVPHSDIRELSELEVDWVSGGPVTASTVLGAGAAIVGAGAIVLAIVALPELAAAAAVYGATAAVLETGPHSRVRVQR